MTLYLFPILSNNIIIRQNNNTNKQAVATA